MGPGPMLRRGAASAIAQASGENPLEQAKETGVSRNMDPKEKTKLNLDGWQDLIAHMREGGSNDEDPFESMVRQMSEAGLGDEADIREFTDLKQNFVSLLHLLEDRTLNHQQRERLEKERDSIGVEFGLVARRLMETLES
jgi:hypothetical protein